MKSLKIVLFAVFFAAFSACSPSSQSTKSDWPSANAVQAISTPDGVTTSMVVDVGGCNGYFDEPCASVTICVPGSLTQCQRIDRLLVDTGSYGLRVFKSMVSLNLPNVTDTNGNPYATCVSYVDGSAQWGPVRKADIVMGGLEASSVSIQIIDADYTVAPGSNCDPSSYTLDTVPEAAGFNGIIGVGAFAQDCGSDCVGSSNANNGAYFACSGSSCSGSQIALADQVINPIAMLPASTSAPSVSTSNGILLQLPAVSDSGAVSVSGTLTFGVAGMTSPTVKLKLNTTTGYMKTVFNGSTLSSSFIDSGSNGLYFPAPTSLPLCSGDLADFYCPATQQPFTATMRDSSSPVDTTGVSFNVANASVMYGTSNPNYVFNNLAGTMTGGSFDWGLPFFLGKTIAVQIGTTAAGANTTSSLGTGPIVAF